ncbi:MAG: hypothetical protein ACO1RA_20940 [Planctomycetaceae bacterium]
MVMSFSHVADGGEETGGRFATEDTERRKERRGEKRKGKERLVHGRHGGTRKNTDGRERRELMDKELGDVKVNVCRHKNRLFQQQGGKSLRVG